MIMVHTIDIVAGRVNLIVRREPYWYKIEKSLRVGFRTMSNEASGTWQVRYRD